jgi:hypothetical protein
MTDTSWSDLQRAAERRVLAQPLSDHDRDVLTDLLTIYHDGAEWWTQRAAATGLPVCEDEARRLILRAEWVQARLARGTA